MRPAAAISVLLALLLLVPFGPALAGPAGHAPGGLTVAPPASIPASRPGGFSSPLARPAASPGPGGSVVETLLPNYNGSLPGDFASTVADWKVGTMAVVPATGTLWLPELPEPIHGPTGTYPAPTVVYNLGTNAFVGIVPALSNASALVYDPANGYLYATDPFTDSVEVYDPVAGQVVDAAIPVGTAPDAIAFDPTNDYLFVANSGSNNVTVINAHNDQVVVDSVPVGRTPVALTVAPTNGWVFVANANDSFLSVINASNPSSAQPNIPLFLSPVSDVAYSAYDGTVAVTSPLNSTMTIVSATKLAVIPSTVAVGRGATAVIAVPGSQSFVVANQSGDVLNIVAGRSIPFNVTGPIDVAAAPAQLAFDSTSGNVLSWSSASRNLTEVNLSVQAAISYSPSLGPTPSSVAFDQGSDYLWVAGNAVNGLEEVNPFSDQTTIGPITTATPPLALALDPTTQTLFVGTNGSVLAFDGQTGTLLAQNTLLSGPNGPLVVDPASGILWDGRGTTLPVVGLNLSTLQPSANATGVTASYLTPQSMTLDAVDQEVFAVSATSGRVDVFNGTSGQVILTGIDAGSNVSALAYDPVDQLVYVAGSNLTAINASTRSVVGGPMPLPTHTAPQGIAYDPSRELVYVSTASLGSGAGILSVVAGARAPTSSDPVVEIPDGWGPLELAVAAPAPGGLPGSDIILSANAGSGTVGVVATAPSISSFTFAPSTLDAGQSTVATVVASGGAGPSTISFGGLPTGCTSKDELSLVCTPSGTGTFTVTATVTDSVGASAAATANLTVKRALSLTVSIGNLTAPATDVNQTLSVSATVTGGDPPRVIEWNFGDGGTARGASAVHKYATPGAFVVQVTVTDSAGATVTNSSIVTVNPLPAVDPVVLGHGWATDAGMNVVLSANGSGGTGPGTISWDFGDGQTGSGAVGTHNWTAPGTYDVSVSYRDALGLYGNSSPDLSMLVDPVLKGTFTSSAAATPIAPGTLIEFTANPVNGTPGYNVTWSFGGGVYAYGTAVSHAFSAPGYYLVKVQMSDAAGASRNDSFNITVTAPSGGSSSPFSGNFGPGLGLGLLVGATVAAVLLFLAERARRRRLPGPPSPYVPPSSSGKGRS